MNFESGDHVYYRAPDFDFLSNRLGIPINRPMLTVADAPVNNEGILVTGPHGLMSRRIRPECLEMKLIFLEVDESRLEDEDTHPRLIDFCGKRLIVEDRDEETYTFNRRIGPVPRRFFRVIE